MSNSIDRTFLIQYIYDEYKSVHGIRPRWINFDEMSDDNLVEMAKELEQEIIRDIARNREHEMFVVLALHHPRGYVHPNEYMLEYEGSIERMISGGMINYIDAVILPTPPKITIGDVI